MANRPVDDPRLLEALEACRPESDDLSDPALAIAASRLAADAELRQAFQRLQQLDASVADAFRDVPVPDGLAERINARLAAARSQQELGRADAGQAVTAGTHLPPAEPARWWPGSRRWALAGAASVALVAVSALVLLVLKPRPAAITPSQLWQEAIDFFDRDGDEQGRPVARVEPPAGYPPAAEFDVVRFPAMRWRWVDDFLGRVAVAYDITPLGAPRATLYVVRYKMSGLPALPPSRPSHTTGNRSAAAWQTGELVYVLVVQGGPRMYQQLLPRRTWT